MATITCVDCGEPVEAKTKARKFCDECNRKKKRANWMATSYPKRKAEYKHKEFYHDCLVCENNFKARNELQLVCKDCQPEYRKKQMRDLMKAKRAAIAADPEKLKEYKKKKYEWDRKSYYKDVEKSRERYRTNISSNPELAQKNRERVRKWIKENPEHSKELSRIGAQNRRRKVTLKLPPREALNTRLNLFGDNTCCYCSNKVGKLQIEHLVPVSKGGDNHTHNIFGACGSCNVKKSNKDFEDWFPKQPFYSLEREQAILTHSKPLEDLCNI